MEKMKSPCLGVACWILAPHPPSLPHQPPCPAVSTRLLHILQTVSELQEEGMNAINLPLSPIPFELDPEDTMLEENEVRTMVDPNSRSDPKLQELMKVLIDWINDVLVGERIIVKDLAEDLYDGQVLQKLFEKLESEKLNVAEVTQSEIAQKQKLQTVLEKINETLKLPPRSIKWNVDSVHAKSLVAILHLLVALSQYFRAPIRLPDHVSIQVVVVQKREGILQSRQIQEEITGNTEALSGRHERDAFDTLFDHAPDKLNVVKKTLITFVNKHLNKLNLEVTELETQFADGVYLVLLMGLLEGYFVPLHSFFLTPDSFEQKVRGGDITGGLGPHGPLSSAHTLLGPCREKAVASRLPRALGSDQQLSWALQTPEHPQRLSLPLLSGPAP
uniref:Parvin alpha n=2 Tax=Canis lupus familiaris TaxID=9615 RepID=A0A8I3P8A5_CANLF